MGEAISIIYPSIEWLVLVAIQVNSMNFGLNTGVQIQNSSYTDSS